MLGSLKFGLLLVAVCVGLFGSSPPEAAAQGRLQNARRAVQANRELRQQSAEDAIAAREQNVELLRQTGPNACPPRLIHAQQLVAAPQLLAVPQLLVQPAYVQPMFLVQPQALVAPQLLVQPTYLPPAALVQPQRLVVPGCHF